MVLNFGDIVSVVLSESRKVSELTKIGAFSGLDDAEVRDVVSMDPTYNGGENVGKYGVYLLDCYVKGELSSLSPVDVSRALSYFNANRGSMVSKRVQDYSIKELVGLSKESVVDVSGVGSWPSVRQMLSMSPSSRYIEVECSLPQYRLFCPLSWEASRKLAGDTEWCTASSDNTHFWNYLISYFGVFIFVDREDGKAKFQYCPDRGEFKDRENEDMYDEGDYVSSFDARPVFEYVNEYLSEYFESERRDVQKRIDNDDLGGLKLVENYRNIGVVEHDGRLAAFNPSTRKLLSHFTYLSVISINYGYVYLCKLSDSDYDDEGDLYVYDEGMVGDYFDDDLLLSICSAMLRSVKDGYVTIDELVKKELIGVVGDYVAFHVDESLSSVIVNRKTLDVSEFHYNGEKYGPIFNKITMIDGYFVASTPFCSITTDGKDVIEFNESKLWFY